MKKKEKKKKKIMKIKMSKKILNYNYIIVDVIIF